ncbi:hypothetical protein SAMN05421752_104152 [Natronorubrum thiooxidans]|uniref:Uncharacterized protein n=1 Tax=Natronorubrum thiooxidans TaxID=308853 RepID=A0A1N7EIY6_9EURY|nr:hypothetical protein SAMN05421752_104152 [Natronorubrum thiooxidans]
MTQELWTPEQYDELSETVDEQQVAANVRISAAPEEHIEWLEVDFELDVDRVFVHNVNTNQAAFVETFGDEVIPAFE